MQRIRRSQRMFADYVDRLSNQCTLNRHNDYVIVGEVSREPSQDCLILPVSYHTPFQQSGCHSTHFQDRQMRSYQSLQVGLPIEEIIDHL